MNRSKISLNIIRTPDQPKIAILYNMFWRTLKGLFQPNPWGLYQVHGNVWEWTGSCYDENYGGMEMRHAGKDEGGPLAARGGSWNLLPEEVRSADRFWFSPAYGNSYRGFRLARSL